MVTFTALLPVKLFAQAPTLSYSSPQTYYVGMPVTPLAPVSNAVAARSYNPIAALLGSGFLNPAGVAVDGAGNVYVASYSNCQVTEIPAGNGAEVELAVDAYSQQKGSVAVDISGNLYVCDPRDGEVIKIAPGGGSRTVIGTGFSSPVAVAVDAAGNVYVTDSNPGINSVIKIPAAGGAYVTIGSGFNDPNGVAVDAAGNVYVADYGNGAVKMIPSGSATPVTIGSGYFTGPYGVAVDASGNLIVADIGSNSVSVIPAGSNTPITIGTGFNTPYSVAADGVGNIYVANYGDTNIKEIKPVGGYYINPALPAGLSFNCNTGIISGTPTTTNAAANYTVSAYNSNGRASATINIQVTLPPVPTISYSSPQIYTAGVAITPLAPVSSNVSPYNYSTSPIALGAGFSSPSGVAIDAAGNLYVGDFDNHLVKEIMAGSGTVITLAPGFTFSSPNGVALDVAGNLYVGDSGANMVYKIPAGGGTPTAIGSGFSTPDGVAVDAAGNVYVANQGNNTVTKIPAGNGTPVAIGSGFNLPCGVAVDAAGNVYVADYGNNAVKKIPSGTGTPVIIGSGFLNPYGVAVDLSGNIIVADRGNNAIKIITPGNPNAPVTIGTGYNTPCGVVEDGAGNIYVADLGDTNIKEIKPVGGYYINPGLPAGLSFNNNTGTIGGTPPAGHTATNYTVSAYNISGNNHATVNITVNGPPAINYTSPGAPYTVGTAIAPLAPVSNDVAAYGYSTTKVLLGSNFLSPSGVAIDAAGNLYVGDFNNHLVKEIMAGSGTVVTLAPGFTFSSPNGVALDAAGNLYIGDSGANKVYKIPAGGGTPTAIGSGFSNPDGVAVDAEGNVYVANQGNNTVTKIPGGNGTPVSIGSGYNLPCGVAVDAAGNVYVADYGSNSVKKIPLGTGTPVAIGSGFTHPYGVMVDASGNLIVADRGNNAIKVIPAGSNTPITIGTGFTAVCGVAEDGAGNIYAADYGDTNIKEIKPVGGYYINALPPGLSLNNNTGTISGTPSAGTLAASYTVSAYNSYGLNQANVNITVNGPPTINYTSPVQNYVVGTAITPLTPAGSNVAAYGYSTNRITVGANFHYPAGVAVDAAGNVYVADFGNHQVKEIQAGTGTVTTLAPGFAFSAPNGIALDAAGNLYVSDAGTQKVYQIPAAGGTPTPIGPAFGNPVGVAVDAAGNVYVADQDKTTVTKIPSGNGAPIIIGSGFNMPTGVAVDAAGNVYVADDGNNAVKKIPLGTGTPVIIGSGFTNPHGVAVDLSGNIIVADNSSNAVKVIPAGSNVPITIGTGFDQPYAVVEDGAGNIYVDSFGETIIEKIVPVGGFYANVLPAGLSLNNNTGTITGTPAAAKAAANYTVFAYNGFGGAPANVNITVNLPPLPTISYSSPQIYTASVAITALAPVSNNVSPYGYSTTPIALGSGFSNPSAVAVDAAGNIYMTDQGSNLVQKISASNGSVTTLAPGYTFSIPNGVAIDAAGNLYIADTGHDKLIEIPAGGGTPVSIGSGFISPYGVAVDAAGNLYVANFGNNTVTMIPAGNGIPVSIGSGYNQPSGVAVDGAGNVYVANYGNNTIEKVPADGSAPTQIGTGFLNPQGLAVDLSGNIIVADRGNNAVKVIPAGSNTTVTIGTGYDVPSAVVVDGAGNIYVADYGDTNIKEIKPVGGYYINALPAGLSFNGNTGTISGTPTAGHAATNYTVSAYDLGGAGQANVNIAVNLPPVPTISYSSPQSYPAGVAITPLAPVSNNVSPYGYSTTKISLGANFLSPSGVAIDAAGNLYVGDFDHHLVKEIMAGSGTVVTLAPGFTFSSPNGVALDAAGNLYVGDSGANMVYKISAGGGTPTAIGSGFSTPDGVAVDAAGNVYVANQGNNTVTEIPGGNGTPVSIGSGYNLPCGVAVDAAGNVYVADYGSNTVKKIPLGTGTPVVIGSGFSHPYGVMVDGAGNIIVADRGNNAIKVIPAGSNTPVTIGTGFTAVCGVAEDGAGNIYAADLGDTNIKEIKPVGGFFINATLPPGLSLNNNTGTISGTPTGGHAATNYTISAYDIGGAGQANVNIRVTLPPTIIKSLNTSTGSNAFSNAASVNYSVIFGATEGGVTAANFTLTTNGVTGATIGVPTSTDNITWNVPVNTGTGSGTVILNLANSTGLFAPITTTLPFAGQTYMIDKTPPTINVGPPSVTSIAGGAGSVTYSVTYADANFNTSTLVPGNITLNQTGTASGTVGLSGSGTSYTVAISGITGNGTLGISIAAGTASDKAGNTSTASASTAFNVVTPIISTTGTPTALSTTSGTASSSTSFNVSGSNMQAGIIVVRPAGFEVSADNSTFSTSVTIGSSGTIPSTPVYVRLAAADAVNNYSGNVLLGSNGAASINVFIPSSVVSTPPGTINSITAGSAWSNAGTIQFTVTFGETITGLSASNFSLTTTGTISGASISSVSSGTNSYTVTVNTGTGNGTIGLNLANAAGVTPGIGTTLPFAGGTTAIDKTPPTITVGSPSVSSIADGAGSVTYSVTYADANFNTSTLVIGNITLNQMGTASGTVELSGSGTSYTVTISGITGYGTLGISIATGTASDKAGNTAPASGASAAFNVVTPSITVTDPPRALSTIAGTASSSTSFNVLGSNMEAGILVTPPPGGGFEVSADNSAFSSTVTVGSSGTISSTPVYVRLKASDGVGSYSGNIVLSSTGATSLNINMPSSTVAAPSTTISSLAAVSSTITNASSVQYTATFAASVSGVSTSDFTLITPGSVSGASVSTVSGSGTTWTITVNTGSGNGAIQLVMNSASGLNPSITNLPFNGAAYTIDKTPPSVTVSAPSVTSIVPGGAGTVTYTVTYADANFNASKLTTAGITLNKTGTANGTVVVAGSGTGYTVTITGIVGAGTLGISVGAGYSSDLPGNKDAGAGPSATFGVGSANDNLSLLKMSNGTLSPVFAAAPTSYTAAVPNTVSSLTVTPTTADPTATVKVNGDAVTSGTASAAIALTVGPNTITTVVKAQDGVTTKTYSVTVTRALPANAKLAKLGPNVSGLSPAFSGSVTGYTLKVSNATASMTLTPVSSDANATIKVNGTTVTSGTTTAPIALAEGVPTVITTVVTAQDGKTKKTYTLTVTRAPSTNATLSKLGPGIGGLTPSFSPTTTSYTISAGNATASITLTPVSSDANATIKVNGATVTSGTVTTPIALAEGAQTVINAVVIAQDGTTTKTYTLTVTRAPSTVATLSKLGPSIGGLTPAFSPATTSYTISTGNATASMTLKPVSSDANATIQVNRKFVTSGTPTAPIALAEGAQTVISIIVRAQNGFTSKTYDVTVTRAPSTNAGLSDLGPSIIGLTPAFSSSTTSYTISAANTTASMTLKPVSSDANATITVNGTAVLSDTTSGPIALAVGPNTITTVVTAQDGTTTKTYTLTVTRASGGADGYVPIAIGTGISVTIPIAIGTTETPTLADDGIQVHQGVSPNGDGINDFLQIDNINQYPDNKLMIMNRNGQLVYETQGYDNSSKVFDGHSNKNGQMQLPGTYFYQLDYSVNGITKHKTGFLVLKY